MIIKPRIRGFICTTTHPVGCEAPLAFSEHFTEIRCEIPTKLLS
ncbi:hypothetical protein [Vibrio diabolicus]